MRSRPLLAAVAAPASIAVCATLAAQPCEPGWSDRLGAGELASTFSAAAVFDDGTGPAIYVGGYMFNASQHLEPLLRMTGTGWTPLQDSATRPGSVGSLASFDDGTGPVLAVGGHFGTEGGTEIDHIAFWDGRTWSLPGGGLGEDAVWVQALAVVDIDGTGPALFAVGHFEEAGGDSVTGIVRWDGLAWSDVGGRFSASIPSLAAFDDGTGPALVAAGSFSEAGGVPASNIARWDGLAWSALGAGLDDPAAAMTVFDDGTGPALYVAGYFLTAGGVTVNGIARWDGAAWSALGTGLDGAPEGLAVFDDGTGAALYATGGFDSAGGVPVNGIARWDGAAWSAVGDAPGAADALVVFDDGSGPALYAAGVGWFVFRWDGTEWRRHGGGIGDFDSPTSEVGAMHSVGPGAAVEPGMYVGGRFPFAGDVDTPNVARFDGERWHALGDGLDCVVQAIEHFDDGSGSAGLFVGTKSDGECSSHGMFRWDGKAWTDVSAGVTSVYDLVTFDDGSGPGLYGHLPGTILGRWNGDSWVTVADYSGPLYDMIAHDDGSGPALYVAGGLLTIDGVPINGIGRFDGSSWTEIGGGFEVDQYRLVRALAVYDDGHGPQLHAGGTFKAVNGMLVNGIARWDGRSWHPVGDGVVGNVYALATVAEGDGAPALYAGGYFDVAGGTAAHGVARWNGSFWSALGTGIDDYVWHLAAHDTGDGRESLFVAGEFASAGGLDSNNIAQWTGCPDIDLPPYLPCRYEVTIIEAPQGAQCEGMGINERGDVVGIFFEAGIRRAFLWTAEDGFLVLPTTPAGEYRAFDVNESRQIAGAYSSASGPSRGLFYDGQWSFLDPAPGNTNSWAYALGNDGTVVGSSYGSAVAWHDGVPEVLTGGSARAINDQGVIVGGVNQSGHEVGFILEPDGTLTVLPPIPGGLQSGIRAVNDALVVAGHGRIPDPHYSQGIGRAFMWHDGRFTVFEPLPGHNYSTAFDVNNAGVVVGLSSDLTATPREDAGVVWHDGVATVLDDVVPWELGLSIEDAHAINDQGQIAGTAYSWRGWTAVLLTPVEQPPGDIDGDCRVDGNDLLALLFAWGDTESPADLDGDGVVGIRDFLILLGHWT